MQDCKLQLQADWKTQSKEHSTLLTQTTFWTLNSDFKFLFISTINKALRLITIQGRLVYNNGSTVFISVSHQSFVQRFLNEKFDSIKKKIIFTIDQSSQTLTFMGKMNNITDLQGANGFIKLCQEELLLRKKCVLCLLAIIGVQLDYENALMRKILIEKKKLKNKLQEILKRNNDKQDYQAMQVIVQEPKNNDEDGGVLFFGQGTDYYLEQKMEEESQKPKKLEGGYFSIEPTSLVVKNKSGKVISKRLVIKTLKQNRKKQNPNLQWNNEIKMKKQIQIISNIKNKRHIIRYYCDINRLNNLSQVYMDQYNHSLQEYVHYLGDSLQLLQKINISKQVVESIIALHQSNVIHRDIKPANFLIDDSSHNANDYKVKIIDFAESYPSYAKNQQYSNIDYACSNPYSPLQCLDKKGFTENGPMEGIGRKEIDYWSVGITIYEIFFRKLPVSFSRAFLVDITSSWKSQLLVAVNQRQKIGFNLVEDIINIICVKMMKCSQDQRMKLSFAKRILQSLEAYVQNLIQIAEDSI